MEDKLKEAREWIAAAHESFRVDMGVMTPKEKSVYRAFIALEARIAELEAENKRLREAVEWGDSKAAMKQSIQLPRGCSPMNGPERMTAEICIDNLQTGLRRRAGKEG